MRFNFNHVSKCKRFPGGSGKESAVQETQEIQVGSLGQEDPLEKGMVAHFSILAWEIPWTEQHGGLQSMGSHIIITRVPTSYFLKRWCGEGEKAQSLASGSPESASCR